MLKLPLGKTNLYTVVDASDTELVSAYKWQVKHDGKQTYARTVINGKQVQLHRLIMGAQPGQRVDHINGNGLDNRRQNLRFCSIAQNTMNSSKRRGCLSKYKGVTWHRAIKKWQAQIKLNGKSHYIGVFSSEREAADAYERRRQEVCKKNFQAAIISG